MIEYLILRIGGFCNLVLGQVLVAREGLPKQLGWLLPNSPVMLFIRVTHRQRESAAQFLYDLAKGVALLTVVSLWVTRRGSWITVVLGTIGTVGLFL